MKGKPFAPIKEIKEKSKQKLLAIPKITFQKCKNHTPFSIKCEGFAQYFLQLQWRGESGILRQACITRFRNAEKNVNGDARHSVKCKGFAYCFLSLQWSRIEGRTVNKEYYLEAMRRLRESIRQKRTDL